jgi:hypothetical protein
MPDTNYIDPNQIHNYDLVTFAKKVDTAMVGILNSESSKVNEILPVDMGRIESWNSSISNYMNLLFTTERVDAPHSTGDTYTINYLSSQADFDALINEDLAWVLRDYASMIKQQTRSDSAQISNGILEDDYNRFVSAMNKMQVLLVAYKDSTVAPLDQPQESLYERTRRGAGPTV